MFLINAKYYSLIKAVCFFEIIAEMFCYCLGSAPQKYDGFKVLCAIFSIRYFSAITVEFALRRPPARCIHRGYYPVHFIRGKKTILNSLLKAVGINRISKIPVGVFVFFPQR